MTERRYALTKLQAGLYLLHGNDVEPSAGRGTVFRISRWEDGPHFGVEHFAVYWSLAVVPFAELHRAVVDAERGVLDDDPLIAVEWEVIGDYRTRGDAVDEAVRISEARRLAAQAER